MPESRFYGEYSRLGFGQVLGRRTLGSWKHESRAQEDVRKTVGTVFRMWQWRNCSRGGHPGTEEPGRQAFLLRVTSNQILSERWLRGNLRPPPGTAGTGAGAMTSIYHDASAPAASHSQALKRDTQEQASVEHQSWGDAGKPGLAKRERRAVQGGEGQCTVLSSVPRTSQSIPICWRNGRVSKPGVQNSTAIGAI